MDQLSELIKEAKPLYKRRKRIKQTCLGLVLLFVPIFGLTNVVNLYNYGNDVYISLNNNELQKELMFDDMKLLR